MTVAELARYLGEKDFVLSAELLPTLMFHASLTRTRGGPSFHGEDFNLEAAIRLAQSKVRP